MRLSAVNRERGVVWCQCGACWRVGVAWLSKPSEAWCEHGERVASRVT